MELADPLALTIFAACGAVALGSFLTALIHSRVSAGAGIVYTLAALGIMVVGIELNAELNPHQQLALKEGMVIELPVARDGHYYLTAELNGVPTRFIVDTGASDIVLTRRDAERIGFEPERLRFAGRASTANGTVPTARVLIDAFELGGVQEDHVPAIVNGGELHNSLLGMRYLHRFSRIEIGDGRLTLVR